MLKQQYYDLLVKSAQDGTFPSRDSYGYACRYRGEGGKKCAVGLLIADEDYNEYIEGFTCTRNRVQTVVQIPEGMTIEELETIQAVHDNYWHKWSAHDFVQQLNGLSLFADVVQAHL